MCDDFSYEHIRCERRGEALILVTINREAEINALNRAALSELTRAFTTLQSDPEARVVILTGAGERAFSAGVETSEISALAPEQTREFARAWQSLTALIEGLGKPVIAAINGSAYGGGCDLALACAFRIAVAGAEFGYPQISSGSLAALGVSRLPRIVGKARALEMILTGETIDAEEAMRAGLIHRVARDRNELMALCEDLAMKISRNAPLAVKYAMEAVNHGMEMSLDEALLLESSLFGLCFATEDVREGTRAFLEKRAPVFRGK